MGLVNHNFLNRICRTENAYRINIWYFAISQNSHFTHLYISTSKIVLSPAFHCPLPPAILVQNSRLDKLNFLDCFSFQRNHFKRNTKTRHKIDFYEQCQKSHNSNSDEGVSFCVYLFPLNIGWTNFCPINWIKRIKSRKFYRIFESSNWKVFVTNILLKIVCVS